jgi:multidrug efflux system membrane fusion protein
MKSIILICIFLACVLSGCSKKKPPQQAELPSIPIHAAPIEIRDFLLHFETIGSIKPFRTAEVKPQVSGLITKVHFTEGQRIQEGDLLYTIEPASYAIKVQEMQAHLAHNLAYLKNVQKKLERYKSLSNKDLIAKVEWDELETQVALYEALAKADKARLLSAKLDLEHCEIRAPISGRTGKTALQVGSKAESDALVTIFQTEPLYVEFAITERELQLLTDDQCAIEVYAAGGGDRSLGSGKVVFLDQEIDPKSRMLAVRGILEKSEHSLWPGQSVRVHLIFGKKTQAKMVPLKAIKTNQGGPYVFSVKADHTVETRSVKLGAEEKGFVVIEEGLEGVEKVVTEGHLRLMSGSKVEEAVR